MRYEQKIKITYEYYNSINFSNYGSINTAIKVNKIISLEI